MMDITERREAVADLVQLRTSVDDAVSALRRFPWDCEDELVMLGPAELRHVLRAFLGGSLSANQLENWANAVEGRDDVSFEPREMIDLVTELANPLLFKPLSTETAREMLQRIDSLLM